MPARKRVLYAVRACNGLFKDNFRKEIIWDCLRTVIVGDVLPNESKRTEDCH